MTCASLGLSALVALLVLALNACSQRPYVSAPAASRESRREGLTSAEEKSVKLDLMTLDEKISAARNPEYEFSYPELLELIARLDPIASNELQSRRAMLQREIIASPATASGLGRILAAICGQLKQGDAVVDTLEALTADQTSVAVRLVIINHALGDLYERRMYEEIVRNSDVIRQMARNRLERVRPPTDAAEETSAVLYEAFLAMHRLSEAREISTWILSAKPTKDTYSRLIAAAERVSAGAEVQRLQTEAQRVEPDGAAPN